MIVVDDHRRLGVPRSNKWRYSAIRRCPLVVVTALTLVS